MSNENVTSETLTRAQIREMQSAEPPPRVERRYWVRVCDRALSGYPDEKRTVCSEINRRRGAR